VRTVDELVAEAEPADVTGWGVARLDGRATQERPPCGYSRLLADQLARAASALDIDTGGGEVVSEASVLPERIFVTEAWPPNAQQARALQGPRAAHGVGRPDPPPRGVRGPLDTSSHRCCAVGRRICRLQ
jgi:hypothetical protein